MSRNQVSQDFFWDGVAAFELVSRRSWRRNVTAWVYVPLGIMLILLACWGVDSLIGISSVSFPASVTCMIVLFLALTLCDVVLGDRRTRELVSIIDVPSGFALRYINVFFTPSFVLLPLSPPISGTEVAKVIAVFSEITDGINPVIGFILMMAVTAYLVRALQLLTGSSKRAITARAEEMGNEEDSIPLTATPRRRDWPPAENVAQNDPYTFPNESTADTTSNLLVPSPTQDPSQIRGTGGPPVADQQGHLGTSQLLQSPLPLTRPQRWAAVINQNFDQITYLVFFLLIGLPVYYVTGYAMPAQLSFNILAYFTALALPPPWKQFLHPVLVSSAITVFGIWILGLISGHNLTETLGVYRTGTKYLQLWKNEKSLRYPGAGDVFASILDASIVALALPMFQYRKELRQHFLEIVLPSVVVSIGSLFGYPILCYTIGISAQRSLSFAARSLTLALATPAVSNLGGDLNTVAALAITSGILGVLVGPRMLQWMRIPEDDYVTRGVTLGGNSSAIATALLLRSDPRAAAMSTLSMTLLGTITVALTSVSPIVQIIKALVGL